MKYHHTVHLRGRDEIGVITDEPVSLEKLDHRAIFVQIGPRALFMLSDIVALRVNQEIGE